MVGAGIELGKQLYKGQQVDLGKVIGKGVQGAIVGGVAGATGGLSLLKYAGASALANAAGGIAGRATEVVANNAILDWHPEALEGLSDYAFDMDAVLVDGIAGGAGGYLGKHLETQAIGQLANRYLNNAAYNRAVQTLRNVGGKSDKQLDRAFQSVQSGINNFFWWATQVRDKGRAAGTAAFTNAAERRKEPGGHLSRICDENGKNCTAM